MNAETNNPFAGPSAESAPQRDTSRKTLLLAAMAIIVLDQLARELSRNAIVSLLIQQRDTAKIAEFYTYATIAGIIGPLIGAVFAVRLGTKRALIFGAVVVAAANFATAAYPIQQITLGAALARGLITTPLYVLAGRSLLDEPELRDAWFTATFAAVTVGSFLGGLGRIATTALGEPILFAISGALPLAIIPITLAVLEEPKIDESPRRANIPFALFAAAFTVVSLGAIPDRFMLNMRNPANQLLVTAQAAFTFLGAVVAAVIYLSRNVPGQQDRARSKIAIGAVAAAFAAALIGSSGNDISVWAATILDRGSTLLCAPIALALAATIRSRQVAYFAVAGWFGLNILSSSVIGVAVAALETSIVLPWASAAVCATIAAVLYFGPALRTGSGTRSS